MEQTKKSFTNLFSRKTSFEKKLPKKKIEQKYNFNNLLKMKLGKKLTQHVKLGNEKKESVLGKTFSAFSKLGSTLSRGITGQVVEKPKISFNTLIKIIDDEKDMMTKQFFNMNLIFSYSFFQKDIPYSLLNVLYKDNPKDIIEIIPRIDFKNFVKTINLQFNIPRSVLLTQNIIEIKYLKDGNPYNNNIKISKIPFDKLLYVLAESLNNINYKNNKMIDLLGNFYDNIEYLKKQQYVDDFNKRKIVNFLNNFVINIFLNYQNNIDFIRFLINKYCNLFGIYLINYNYIDLLDKLSRGNNTIKFVEEVIKTSTSEVIDENNRPGILTKTLGKPGAKLSGKKYVVQKILKIIDNSTDFKQEKIVYQYEWDNFYNEINKYFKIDRNFNESGIINLGIDLIKLLFFNIFNACNTIYSLINLIFDYNGTKLNQQIGFENKIQYIKSIYSKIIQKKFIPVRKEVIENKQSVIKLIELTKNYLSMLIGFYLNKTKNPQDYQNDLQKNKELLIKVLQNINLLYNMKNIQKKLEYSNNPIDIINLELCRFFNIINKKIVKDPSIFSDLNFFDEKIIQLINININNKIFSNNRTFNENNISLKNYVQNTLTYVVNYYIKCLEVNNLDCLEKNNYAFISFFNFLFNEKKYDLLEKFKTFVSNFLDFLKLECTTLNMKIGNKFDNKYYDLFENNLIYKFIKYNVQIINKYMEFLKNITLYLNEDYLNSVKTSFFDLKNLYNGYVKYVNQLFEKIDKTPKTEYTKSNKSNLVKYYDIINYDNIIKELKENINFLSINLKNKNSNVYENGILRYDLIMEYILKINKNMDLLNIYKDLNIEYQKQKKIDLKKEYFEFIQKINQLYSFIRNTEKLYYREYDNYKNIFNF